MKKCILVLGMHRSGTSAITGVFKIMGIGLGAEMMEPLPENPKGYFENVTAYNINEKILHRLSSAWDDPLFKKIKTLQSDKLAKYQKKIVKMINREFSKDKIFCIKDPRLCNLLPIWRDALTGVDIDLSCILVLRHPLEVAKSLRAREGFSIEKGILLWMMYMFNAESFSRALLRGVVLYDDVLKDTKKITKYVSSCLDIIFPKSWPNVHLEIEKFLDRNLKHHNVKRGHCGNGFFKMADNLYHLLLKLRSQREDVDQVLTSIDMIRKEFDDAYTLFYNDDVYNNAVLEDEIRQKNRQINSQKWIISQNEIWARKLQKQLQEAGSAKTELTAKIKQQEDFTKQIQLEQAKDRNRYNAEIDRMNKELNLIKGSRVWRTAESVRRLIYP